MNHVHSVVKILSEAIVSPVIILICRVIDFVELQGQSVFHNLCWIRSSMSIAMFDSLTSYPVFLAVSFLS